MMDVNAVELRKTDELGNVPNNLWFRPQFKKLMICLSWPITIRGHIIANKFKSMWKDEAFLETQGQMIRSAHLKLALHVTE
jgi:hypothetical protein